MVKPRIRETDRARRSFLASCAGLVASSAIAHPRPAHGLVDGGLEREPLGWTFPSEEWSVVAPERFGLDRRLLQETAVELGGRGCVIKDGYLVGSWGDIRLKGGWFSSVKPLFSTMLFFAMQEGKVAGVDEPIARHGWRLTGKDRGICFHHLANMTSGYARPEPPGAAFSYNDYAISLYQRTLFDKVFAASGEPDATRAVLAPGRLGSLRFQDSPWLGSNRHLWCSVRDYARIAWFWLNHGRWGDRALLPSDFFERWMRPGVPADLPNSDSAATNDVLRVGTFGGGSNHFTRFGAGIYGFNWWFNARGRNHPDRLTWPEAPADTIMTIGFGGNCSVLIPSRGIVLVSACGRWGKLEPNNPDAMMNRVLRILNRATSPRVIEAGLIVKEPSNQTSTKP